MEFVSESERGERVWLGRGREKEGNNVKEKERGVCVIHPCPYIYYIYAKLHK